MAKSNIFDQHPTLRQIAVERGVTYEQVVKAANEQGVPLRDGRIATPKTAQAMGDIFRGLKELGCDPITNPDTGTRVSEVQAREGRLAAMRKAV